MAKKEKTSFVCQSCGAKFSSWVGRCSTCGEWNSLIEDVASTSLGNVGKSLEMVGSSKLPPTIASGRISTGNLGLDEVLGGGFVPGSVVLVAGEPGIGKSTLLLQLAAIASENTEVLYASGEESVEQVGMRAERLKAKNDKLKFVASNSADDIVATIIGANCGLVIVDSIQTVGVNGVSSAIGSVSQITNATHLLIKAAKQSNTALILVGHVTKEGSIAGPKILEHMVDVVLQLEGDRYGGFKILRSSKNRFGSTNESAIYAMEEQGLRIVDNPSAALLAERQVSDGSVVMATLEGARPILVEVQALVNPTSYGYPKRAASGIDLNRVNLLIAMLERRTKLKLGDKDIYINIVGGIKISEPAADLAICMAIASAAKGMKLKKDAVVFGEVGLSGEVRRVPFMEKRIAEAEKLGFVAAIGPKPAGVNTVHKFLLPVKDVRSALNQFLTKD